MYYFFYSNDYGIYVVKHLEHLIVDKTLTDVVDMHMRFWREKLCIDIFYYNLDP